ncbi:unnamed protein product [Calypogeia fissa]
MTMTATTTTEKTEKTTSCCTPSSGCCRGEKVVPLPQKDGNEDTVRDMVRNTYGKAVKEVFESADHKPSCCGSKATIVKGVDPITRDLYSQTEASEVPADALLASFGCGNPTALAQLHPGEVVLDLGSGGGIDVLLSARRVGPKGKAYGLDMTPEMMELARRNQKASGIQNVEFIQGSIEDVPLPSNTLDVIISNCVINLSPDKDQVLREAFRLLRPGGRFAVSDIVLRRPLADEAKKSIELWAGCIAGALLEEEYLTKLGAAGFVGISIQPTRIYNKEDTQEIAKDLSCCGSDAQTQMQALDGAAMSAFIRARKPNKESASV